ncbi:hypothetical protein LCGC14_0368360 [marine sediment metagenome]|uniref:Uncharacterized protein n=1 Tax=marine sediment metagenome TaxID=412755 RepID=A0A0F9TBV1_9ZZZZ
MKERSEESEKYSFNGHNLDETNICLNCREDFDAKDPIDIECKKKKDDKL